MIILALDASTKSVGWILADGGQIEDAGVFVPRSRDWVQRVAMIGNFVRGKIWDHDVEYLAYEVPAGNRGNMATHRKLGAVEYVIRLASGMREVEEILEIYPQEIKSTHVHKGNPGCALQVIRRDLGDLFEPPREKFLGDLADAVGCYLVTLAKLRKDGHYD